MKNPILNPGAYTQNSVYEGANELYINAEVYDSELGHGSMVGQNALLLKVKLGRYSCIGENVRTGLGVHPTDSFVSTYPGFYDAGESTASFHSGDKPIFQEFTFVDEEEKFVVDIGSDVWIANNVMILNGVSIGHGAVVGCGSIVTKDVEPYSICVGNPAKMKRYRFPAPVRAFLLQFKWWEKDPSWISEHRDEFLDINRFYEKHNAAR